MLSLIKNYIYPGQSQSTPSRKTYGWIKDTHNESSPKKYKIFSYHKQLKSIKSIDLRNQCPTVYDQGTLGSCTANAICGAYEFEMLKQKEVLDESTSVSRLFLYYCERDLEGTTDSDSGAQIKDGITVAKKGLCTEKLWPYDISKFSVKPPENCYDNEKYHRCVDAEPIGLDNIEMDIKQSLLDGYPVIFGIQLYQEFESDSVAQTGIVSVPQAGEKLLGGHAMLIVGFLSGINQVDKNREYFIVRNSWSAQWGDKGYCYIPVEYVSNNNYASDFWSIRLVNDSDTA